MSIYIFTEITADYPKDCPGKDLTVLPMTVSIGDDSYDNITTFISPKEFYERMQAGALTNTAMVQPYMAKEAFEEKLKEGYDVLYVGFSSALSGRLCARNSGTCRGIPRPQDSRRGFAQRERGRRSAFVVYHSKARRRRFFRRTRRIRKESCSPNRGAVHG